MKELKQSSEIELGFIPCVDENCRRRTLNLERIERMRVWVCDFGDL